MKEGSDEKFVIVTIISRVADRCDGGGLLDVGNNTTPSVFAIIGFGNVECWTIGFCHSRPLASIKLSKICRNLFIYMNLREKFIGVDLKPDFSFIGFHPANATSKNRVNMLK